MNYIIRFAQRNTFFKDTVSLTVGGEKTTIQQCFGFPTEQAILGGNQRLWPRLPQTLECDGACVQVNMEE